MSVADTFAKNLSNALPGPYATFLPPPQEKQFRDWVTTNGVPFDPMSSGPQDYDMRGFWQALMSGDPRAATAIDPNDAQLHFPDTWKTPGHETFSSDSQWAGPMAPRWNPNDQLEAPSGRVLFDDRAQPPPPWLVR